MADCTYCGKGYEPRQRNPMGRCLDCGSWLVYLYGEGGDDWRLEVGGSADGDWLMFRMNGPVEVESVDRIGAMRLRDELDHWLASTVDYETTASTEGEVVSTGRPRDVEAIR